MSRKRRTFTAEQKAEVVRRQVSGKEAVSDLADELGVQPRQIHTWVKQVLDQADKAFVRSAGQHGPKRPRTIASSNCRPSWPTRTKSSPS